MLDRRSWRFDVGALTERQGLRGALPRERFSPMADSCRARSRYGHEVLVT